MEESRIKRINELYHKSQAEGLTEDEKKEQALLRLEYVASISMNLRSQLIKIDMVIEEAYNAGALGGKLLGAGGGGFVLLYCPYNVKHQVARRLEAAGGQLMDWNFELRGAQSWICDEDRWDYRDIQVQMPDKEYTFHV